MFLKSMQARKRPPITAIINTIKNSPFKILLGSISFTFVLLITLFALRWLFLQANWNVIVNNFDLFIIGSYPPEGSWRPKLWLVSTLILCLVGNI